MDQCESFLKEAECHFNWDLSQIVYDNTMPMVVKLKNRIDENSAVSDSTSENAWPLRLTCGYELFSEDPAEAENYVEGAIQEILTSEELLNVKYRLSFLHIAYSTKAFLVSKSGAKRLAEVEQLVGLIKPKSGMSDSEMSGLLAMKAQMLRYYGPDGTARGLPLLREAIERNPAEPEWKISLVVNLNRDRHGFKDSDFIRGQIEEPFEILEELLSSPELTTKQTVTCKYYLAAALFDYSHLMSKRRDSDTWLCRKRILQLCEEFYDKTDYPQFVAFCAGRFAESENHKRLGKQIIENFLDKFPSNVAVNITACKILKREGDFAKAAEHAQTAMNNGCYAAVWLLFDCKRKLKDEFDEEEFFREVITLFINQYKTLTHLKASMYYFFSKKDVVKGAYHIYQALIADPNYKLLWDRTFCSNYLPKWRQIPPIEVAYNQVVFSLKTDHPKDDLMILNGTKRKIEEVASVEEFETSRNIVEEHFNYRMTR